MRVAQRLKHLPGMRETGFDPWVGKIPWRRKWQPTPGLLPGKFHGLRSQVGYSPWGRKESDTTERLHSLFTLRDMEEVHEKMAYIVIKEMQIQATRKHPY